MNMDTLKIEQKEDMLIIEGELDVEFDITGIHPGYSIEDEEYFEKSTLELKTYGDILNDDIKHLIEWINRKSVTEDPAKWPRWKIIIERLND